MLLLNTIESFKQMDKAKWIKTQGEKVWNCIQSGDFWENPSSLCTFSAIIYADLKKFHFYYWFNFPSFNITDDVKGAYWIIQRFLNSLFFELFSIAPHLVIALPTIATAKVVALTRS